MFLVNENPGAVTSALVALTLAACASAPFPREMFTIEGKANDRPLMLSKPESKPEGRTISAASGFSHAQSSTSYSTGAGQVSVVRQERRRSEMPASIALSYELQRGDVWVQLKEATWLGTNLSVGSSSSFERRFVLAGIAVETAP